MIQKLDWDSHFFGFEVGLFHVQDVNFDIESFKKQADFFKLVYIFSDNRLSDISNFELVDQKTVLEKTIDLSLKNNDSIISFNAKEHDYAQLLDLCFLSGKFSRFRIDSKIPSTKFEALYKLWIDNSVNKTFAFDTLIKITENNISGFITIKKVNQDVSEIGLIAVNTNYQGRGIASELLNQAQYISLKNGFKTIRVPTQYDNKPAINLYQKTGFQIVNTTFVYHYWNI
ncbi:MAG TPA: hypothetical protein DDZ41_02680 [Flavobacterium sp.]|nr:hypothetical protein [Flavobacterium sp.]